MVNAGLHATALITIRRHTDKEKCDMRTFALDAILMTMTLLLLSAPVSAAEDVRAYPHSDSGDCAICHVAPENKLRGWFVFGSTKRELKADLNQLCLKCHTVEPIPAGGSLDVGIGHATGKKTAVNHQNLPLASDGTITCATTCHNMHVISDDRQQQIKHLRLPSTLLCVSCHDV
jgi:hypothetical protein